jgi:predicted metalloprotease
MVRLMVRSFSRAALLAMVLAMVISAFGTTLRAEAQTETDAEAISGVSGNTYTSPTFGYSVEWDRTWEVRDERVEDEYNMLRLDDDGSILYIEGYAPALATDECIETYGIAYVESSDGVSDIEAADPIEAADGALSVELTFLLTFEDEDTGESTETEFAGYISCQEINDGDASLVITHLGIASLWNDETEAREDVLATLSLDGQAPTGDADDSDDEPVEEPTAGDSANSDDVASVFSDIQGDGDLPDNADELITLFRTSMADIDDFWTREFPLISGGASYEPATEIIPWVGEIDTPCGLAVAFDEEAGTFGDGPFYCPPNNTIYLDMGFANFQFQQVGEVPFLIPVVLAHEVGHHVQELLGMEVCYQTPCLDPGVLTSQEIEYMADCWAGSWSRDAELRGRLGASDIEANIIQYVIILGGGQEGADPGGHGRGSERIWWFLNGYLEGSNKCYETSSVTAGWAQGGPTTDVTPTEEPADEPTDEPEDEPTEEAGGDTGSIGDSLDIGTGTLSVTSAIAQDVIENREADGTFVIAYVDFFPGEDADGEPFDYEAWQLIDDAGNAVQIDIRATDLLLTSAYENGVDEVFTADSGYGIALVFDIDSDATGLILVNEDAGIQIDLDI